MWLMLRIMPRTWSLSGCTTVWRIRLSPSARTVRFCVSLKPMGLRTSVILSSGMSGSRGRFLDFAHPRHHLLYGFAAELRYVFGTLQLLKRLQGGPCDVDGVSRSQRLTEHI